MPWEYTALLSRPVPIDSCPVCQDKPFDPFMRGMVQRSCRTWFTRVKRPYCALICAICHAMVGYEDPDGNHEFLSVRKLRKARDTYQKSGGGE